MKPEDLGTYYESILEKEARKEGGIYYSPPLVVEYMVENSVGELLNGKTPAEAADIKIVDPACGGGVFLLGAYQFLLDWHEKHYGKLTLAQRRKILLDNIYGVDIDPLAVEITKYGLAMKCSEGNNSTLDLNANICCGDSLIETDFHWLKEFPRVFEQGGKKDARKKTNHQWFEIQDSTCFPCLFFHTDSVKYLLWVNNQSRDGHGAVEPG